MGKKILIVIIVVVAVVVATILAFVLMDEDAEEQEINNVEASTDGINVGDVRHSPKNPVAGGDVHYSAKVEGLPSGYTVLLCSQRYDNDTLIGRYTATLLREFGITYRDTEILNEDASGLTIKYKIMIYEQDWREVDDLYRDYEPILESDLHTYIVQ